MKGNFTLETLFSKSLATEHGWRYSIIDVVPGEWYPNRNGTEIRADKPVTVLYEWSPAGIVDVACRDARAPGDAPEP